MNIQLNYNPMGGGYRNDPTLTHQGGALITFDSVNSNVIAEMREFQMLRSRYDAIMAAIQAGTVGPDDLDVLFELGQLAELLGLDPEWGNDVS